MAVYQGLSCTATKQILCRYYMHGTCREGDNCRYSHDLKDKPSMVCKYYLQGACYYGSKCRYDHVKPRSKSSSGPKPMPLLPQDVEDKENNMVTLTKHKPTNTKNWADAAEFLPGGTFKGCDKRTADAQETFDGTLSSVSYSAAAQYGLEFVDQNADEDTFQTLCPYEMAEGECPFIESCSYLHGLECEYCGMKCLHPYDTTQQEEHRQACIEIHEKDMEHSFAVQRSEGVTCGICLEAVRNKENPSDQRFGILTNCNHAFCLSCIRQWRGTSDSSANKIVRTCPICRVPSAFVTPSEVWVDDPVEKGKLIEGYKTALKEKPCRYFNEGKGTCPFGSSCFYKHAYPDGRIEEVSLRRWNTSQGKTKIGRAHRLWDFLEALEDERTTEYTIIVLEDTDDTD
ncbi:putative E3 ubiquitin-protein ligase makorin-1 [Acropora palmata]|uniref:putative E3 ubiquitin-protein ligase makorin-1 n=1 Tax=Acropora palmata TaxID=6131 RepID=UPI003D9FE766